MVSIQELKELAQNYTVLYVEDEVIIRSAFEHYLKNFFKKVDIAVDGEDGLSLYKKSSYDIVITDIEMPNMNGIDMASKIKEIDDAQEIVIISAYAEVDFFINSIELGVSGYLLKPIDYKQINGVLYKILDKLEKFKENEIYKTNLEELLEIKSQEQQENFEKTILMLVSMIDKRDTYTGGHSQRVANYSKLIAQDMGYDIEECDLLYRAGILHDIGKITIPDSILLKPGKLSPLEYKIIQEHVLISRKILEQTPGYEKFIEIIMAHHEHYDGSGYPNGLRGNAIPELAHIMIVADAFDAMTTSRIYKARKTIDSAMVELKEFSGTHFHPLVVQSAQRVLSHVHISDEISQLPKSELEEERFVYFYKDQLTDLYNSEYFDLMLIKNIHSKSYTHIYTVFLHNFSKYNTEHGWNNGDIILKQFSGVLREKFPSALLFRIHGDDFVILTDKKYNIKGTQFQQEEPLLGTQIGVSVGGFLIKEQKIDSLETFEHILSLNHV